ncbi:MAG TPA: F0F1 ATP synthase subunit A [Chthoniobacteraceae bacterium]|jgi:F-type H+-transporting ATPase subunit a|nr:F0F1 ATP synthase subunit A [Chthoniobacteraceae bacterium]
MSTLSSSASFPHWRPALLALLALACLCFGTPVFAQEAKAPAPGSTAVVEDPAPGEHAAAGHAEHKEGLPPASPVIGHIGPLPINSSMVFMWIVAIGLIAFAQYATRSIKQVPDGAQNFWEFLVEGLRNFLESIIGRHLTKETFWFFASVFIFILAMNWFGLIPGVGTIGWGTPDAHGALTHIEDPLLRGANADLNMTLAMSIIFFACWIYWAIKSNGVGGFLLHLFGPKGDTKGFVRVLMIVVFALVGVLEIVSILFRPVSLSFRLYGNIFAGENILESMSNIVPGLAWLIPVPFYFMELLVGVVQALVFMLLTAVFTLLICSHGEEPNSGDHGHGHH